MLRSTDSECTFAPINLWLATSVLFLYIDDNYLLKHVGLTIRFFSRSLQNGSLFAEGRLVSKRGNFDIITCDKLRGLKMFTVIGTEVASPKDLGSLPCVSQLSPGLRAFANLFCFCVVYIMSDHQHT